MLKIEGLETMQFDVLLLGDLGLRSRGIVAKMKRKIAQQAHTHDGESGYPAHPSFFEVGTAVQALYLDQKL